MRSAIGVALWASIIAPIAVPSTGAAQEAERCACRYAKADSTLSGGRDVLCYRSEAVTQNCSLDWAPPRGTRVTASAFPPQVQGAIIPLLVTAGSRPALGDGRAPIITEYGHPEYWQRVLGVTSKIAGLQGSPSPEDSIGAFLSNFEGLSEYQSEAVGGLLYLTASALLRMKLPEPLQVEILRQLMMQEKQLFTFLTKGPPRPLEIPITLNAATGAPLTLQANISFGCFEVHGDGLRLSVMIKPGWGERSQGVCRL